MPSRFPTHPDLGHWSALGIQWTTAKAWMPLQVKQFASCVPIVYGGNVCDLFYCDHTGACLIQLLRRDPGLRCLSSGYGSQKRCEFSSGRNPHTVGMWGVRIRGILVESLLLCEEF